MENTRPEIDTDAVFARLDAALELIQRYAPHHFRRLSRDFAHILVQRFACRGAYLSATRSCVVELTFSVNESFSPAQVAATILHEAMHARLHKVGYRFSPEGRAREERFCRRAEIEFGSLLPDGAPIVRRALDALEGTDDEVAPEIDWSVAARRVAQADLDSARLPTWMKRVIAQRRGLEPPSEPRGLTRA